MTQQVLDSDADSRRYDRFFDLSRDLLAIADFRGYFVRVNRAFAHATGYSVAELRARPYIDFVHPDDRDTTARESLPLLSGQAIDTLENRFRCRDGSYRWLAWTATSSTEEREIYTSARDITELVRERQASLLLTAIGDVLAASLDYRHTLQRVARRIVPTLADWCAIELVEAGERFNRVALVGPAAAPDQATGTLPGDPHWLALIRQVVQRGQPELLAEITAHHPLATAHDAAQAGDRRALDLTSSMIIPLIARGRTLGAIIFLTTTSGHRYDARDLTLARDLTRRIALALDNALLFQSSQDAQQQLGRQADRLRAVAEASRALAEVSLDERAVLETVTRQIADLIGDICVIRLVSDDGQWLEPVALHHTDPEALTFIRTMFLSASQRIDEGLNGQVMRSGQPLLLPRVEPARLNAAIKPEYRAYRERFGGAHSILIVPWCLHGRTLGVVSISREHPDRPYTLDDQHLLQDLTDRAALAVDNARLYRESQSAVQAREQFLVVATHELRTPLTAIRGNVELALRRVRRTDVALDRVALEERLGRLLTGIDRMTALAARLLDVTRMQAGAFAINPVWCDLALIAGAVTERARVAAPRDPPTAIAYDPPAAPLFGQFDPVRIEQVITNLLDNAIKYQPNGGTVRIRIAGREQEAVIAVTDEGIGIAAEDMPRLFDSFVRTATAVSQQIGGVGVGLYITDQIVRRHGGKIEVRSAVGQGSTFTVRLPLR